jgi:hypothetical protein
MIGRMDSGEGPARMLTFARDSATNAPSSSSFSEFDGNDLTVASPLVICIRNDGEMRAAYLEPLIGGSGRKIAAGCA